MQAHASKKILLVDNMELALKMEEEILRRSGMQILTARSGPEAIEITKTNQPDLVILEMNMPDMSGLDCCRSLQQMPHFKQMPIVMMVADLNSQIMDQCFEANCQELISKPLNQLEVLEKISHLLQVEVRRYPRLVLKTVIRAHRADHDNEGESLNLNQRGILINATQAFKPHENYRLNFDLSRSETGFSTWARLERQLAPGDPKNPGNTYLALFRFLGLPESIKTRIDQLANLQARHKGDQVVQTSMGTNLQELEKSLQVPLENYQYALGSLLNNRQAPLEGFSTEEAERLKLTLSMMKPWEKDAFRKTNPDADSIKEIISLKAKLEIDIHRLGQLPALPTNDQEHLKQIQGHYLRMPDKIIDNIQDRINVQMQANQLDSMKQLNQTKTEAFQKFVAIKSLMNRLTNPEAAAEAQNFRYDPQDEDQHQHAVYQKAKVTEETTKKDRTPTGPRKKKRPTYGKLIAVVFLWMIMAASMYFFGLEYKPKVQSRVKASAKVNLQTPLGIQHISKSDVRIEIYLDESWKQFDYFKRDEYARDLYNQIRKQGFLIMVLMGPQGNRVGVAQPPEGLVLNE